MSFSILVHRSPTSFFRNTRRLRQGNPLSPSLFVIGIEVFSWLINSAMDRNFLNRLQYRWQGGTSVVSFIVR